MTDPSVGTLRRGEILAGVVQSVFPYGVFLRLDDGTQAYIRQRELTLAGDEDPRQVTSVGARLEGMIIELPSPGRSLELSRRRILPDPWPGFIRQHRVGDIVTATVRDLTVEGVTAELTAGIMGWIPLAELSSNRIDRPEEIVWRGDLLEAQIIQLEPIRRRIVLSIRRRLAKLAQADMLAKYFYRPTQSSETQFDVKPLASKSALDEPHLETLPGPILLVEDHDSLRDSLASWLKRRGCRVAAYASANEALANCSGQRFSAALVDLDLRGTSGLALIHELRARDPELPCVVMSDPAVIAQKWHALVTTGIQGVLTKPFDLREVLAFLGAIAEGRPLDFIEDSIEQSSSDSEPDDRASDDLVIQSSRLMVRLQFWAGQILCETGAEKVILFEHDPATARINCLASAGDLKTHERHIYELRGSPVNDVISRNAKLLVSKASFDRQGRLSNLLEFVNFEACCGVPVMARGQVNHALFIFSRTPSAFSQDHSRRLETWAEWLGVAIEGDTLRRHLGALSGMLLSGQMAAGFGHEVFNRLTAMDIHFNNLRGEFERLAETHSGSGASPEFNAVEAHVIQALDTATDLRRIAEGFREVLERSVPRVVDANEVLRQAAQQIAPMASKEGIDIRLQLTSALLTVNVERAALYQVGLNLMLNAIQHMNFPNRPCRALTLRTSLGTAEDPLPIQIRCEDTGIGIHRNLWERVFDLGFTTRAEGTGLGLYIARDLVGRMGGLISVELSLIEVGTTFLVRLPTCAAP